MQLACLNCFYDHPGAALRVIENIARVLPGTLQCNEQKDCSYCLN